jgi:hypothetical protein
MRHEEFIALTATMADVPQAEAARVLDAAAELTQAQSGGEQSPPTGSVDETVDVAEPTIAASLANAGEPSEPSRAAEQAPLAAALQKADAAFGVGDGSRASRLAYSERSGLLG